jgi:hypothetical protein
MRIQVLTPAVTKVVYGVEKYAVQDVTPAGTSVVYFNLFGAAKKYAYTLSDTVRFL